MKDIWKQEIKLFEELNSCAVTKADFTGVFDWAYLHSFTFKTVKAAFKATDIHLFDCTIITPEQMKPSISTSVKGSFPLL